MIPISGLNSFAMLVTLYKCPVRDN